MLLCCVLFTLRAHKSPVHRMTPQAPLTERRLQWMHQCNRYVAAGAKCALFFKRNAQLEYGIPQSDVRRENGVINKDFLLLYVSY